MLKRTQVRQIEPVYISFLNKYPDLLSLKDSPVYELLSALGQLSLHYKVLLLYDMTTVLFNKNSRMIPSNYLELLNLPGISHHLASAFRFSTWGYPEALIDTNTMGIVCKRFDITMVDSLRRIKKFMELMILLVDRQPPREYNYALLELADRRCTKRSAPECSGCPVEKICKTGSNRLKV